MLTGGEFGYGYKSDADGDTWTLSYAGAHFQGPSHTINALSWARSVNYNNWRTCIVACNKELWYYDGIGGGWNSLLIGDEYKFTATTNYIDPRGWAAFWHIAGLKNGIPCLYYYYYFQGGTYIYFHELDASMFENKITDMTNMYGQPVIAVTAGGEVATTGSSPGDFFEIVYDCDTALYATCLFYTERSDSTKIFVAGDNGFMKYAITTDQSTWFSINSSGITSRINTMATDCDEDGAGGSILVAGGNGGQFSYSLDEGQTFIPYDIGFGTANINDITYYPHDNSFYAVGEHGKIARIKFTLE
jgi:hypothetical protein